MAGLFPGGAKGTNLGGLLDMERLTGLIEFEGRRLQVHSKPGGPDSGRIGTCTPPDPITQSFGVGLETQQPRWIGKHRTWVRLSKSLAAKQFDKFFGVASAHVGIVLTFTRGIAKIAPPINHLLRRTTADSQLQAAASSADGSFRLGTVPIDVVAGVARVRGTSTIAGSTATMDQLFRTVAGLGSDPDTGMAAAVQMTSATPARALGLEQLGSLRPGYDANLVVLDHDLQVTAVMVNGDWRVGLGGAALA